MARMTAQPQPTHSAETTVVPVILGVALGHFLNDLMQSLIPAAYPLLKGNLALSFTQIGLITFVFQGTASILQPLVGLYTDRRPLPFALAAGMASTGAGLILLAHAASFGIVLLSVAFIGLGSAIFHPEASRIARLAAGMRPGFAQSVFQVGGNAGLGAWPAGGGLHRAETGPGLDRMVRHRGADRHGRSGDDRPLVPGRRRQPRGAPQGPRRVDGPAPRSSCAAA
jgi:FSR family fosmidomycin resistance protein-like MFS transporter